MGEAYVALSVARTATHMRASSDSSIDDFVVVMSGNKDPTDTVQTLSYLEKHKHTNMQHCQWPRGQVDVLAVIRKLEICQDSSEVIEVTEQWPCLLRMVKRRMRKRRMRKRRRRRRECTRRN